MDLDFMKFFIHCFKYYYPGLLGDFLILEMPMLFRAIFQLIKTWLPQRVILLFAPDCHDSCRQSLKKIKQVKVSELEQYIAADQRLVIHGGLDAYEFRYLPTPDGASPQYSA